MGYTKRQFIEEAFSEIGIGSSFDLQPNELESALRKLDAMMATWNSMGIRIGYPIPSSPEDSSLDEETNVPDSANETIFLNLAKRLSNGYGKQVSQTLLVDAKRGFKALLSKTTKPEEMSLSKLPLGAGYKAHAYGEARYIREQTESIDLGKDDTLTE